MAPKEVVEGSDTAAEDVDPSYKEASGNIPSDDSQAMAIVPD